METPNKLHCMHRPNGDYSCSTTPFGGSAEYIRKDAILALAKEERGKWSSESNTAQGVKMGITLVMDIIESL